MNKLETKSSEMNFKTSRKKVLNKVVVYEKAVKLCKTGLNQNQVFEKILCEISADKVSRICDEMRSGNGYSCTEKEAREIFSIVDEVFIRESEAVEEIESVKRYKKSFLLVAFVSLILFLVSVSFFMQLMF